MRTLTLLFILIFTGFAFGQAKPKSPATPKLPEPKPLITGELPESPLTDFLESRKKRNAVPLSTCSENLLKADIRGLRLGMTKEEVRKVNDVFEWNTEENGTEFGYPFGSIKSDVRFEGVKSIYLKIYEGKVFRIEVYYEGYEWKSLEEFVNAISKNWNISEKWGKQFNLIPFIECDTRQIYSTEVNRLILSDTSAVNKIEEKIKTEKESKLKTFKP